MKPSTLDSRPSTHPMHAITATVFDLLTAIESGEHHLITSTQRDDLAVLLADAARALANTSQRLRLSPSQAEALRYLQHNQPANLN